MKEIDTIVLLLTTTFTLTGINTECGMFVDFLCILFYTANFVCITAVQKLMPALHCVSLFVR